MLFSFWPSTSLTNIIKYWVYTIKEWHIHLSESLLPFLFALKALCFLPSFHCLAFLSLVIWKKSQVPLPTVLLYISIAHPFNQAPIYFAYVFDSWGHWRWRSMDDLDSHSRGNHWFFLHSITQTRNIEKSFVDCKYFSKKLWIFE